MALKFIMLFSAFLTGVPSVSQAGSHLPPHHVRGVFGASVTLPCDGLVYRGVPKGRLDVLWRTSGGEKVARYSGGTYSLGLPFEGRVALPSERIGGGDFSLAFEDLAFSDGDSYLCVWSEGGGREKLLANVTLIILAPRFLNSQSVPAGAPVTLPCYSRVARTTPDRELFLRWRRDGTEVLRLAAAKFTYHNAFTDRASVPLDALRRGDFSLTLKVTGPADGGTYECSVDGNRTGASVRLKVEDHRANFIIEAGRTFNITLPSVPVRVLFLGTVGGNQVLMCTTFVDYARCEADYNDGRVAYKKGSLQLRNVNAGDEGRYTVRAEYNDIIVKEVSLKVTTALPRGFYGFLITASVFLLLLVMSRLKFWKMLRSFPLLVDRISPKLCSHSV